MSWRISPGLGDLKKSDFRFPLVYDDISDHLDRNSQKNFINVLEELAKETQVIILTHDEVFADLITKTSKEANLINLNAL